MRSDQAVLAGCQPPREEIEDQIKAQYTQRIEKLEADLTKVKDQLKVANGEGGARAGSVGATSQQLDKGTMLIYDPDLSYLDLGTPCSGHLSKVVKDSGGNSIKVTDLPIGAIIVPERVSATSKPNELWVTVKLKGDCARDYLLDRGTNNPFGILPWHGSGADGKYEAHPTKSNHHRVTLHRVHDKPAILEKVNGKFAPPKNGNDAMQVLSFNGTPPKKNDTACLQWTQVFKDIWTYEDADGNDVALWDTVQCATTGAAVEKCDGSVTQECKDS